MSRAATAGSRNESIHCRTSIKFSPAESRHSYSMHSFRSLSADNEQHSDLGPFLESDGEDTDVATKKEKVVYTTPPTNFVRIIYGASQTLLLNSNCRRKIFVNYLTKKIGAKSRIFPGASLDLCSEDGTLLKLESLDANLNIDHLFVHGSTYFPCIVARTDAGFLESITPCLKRWEKLYPTLPDLFNRSIQRDQEEARKKKVISRAVAAAAANLEEKKDKDKDKESPIDRKKKGK